MSYDCGIGVIFGNVFLDCFFGVIGFVGVLAVLCGCVDCVGSGCVSGVGLLVVSDRSVFRSVVFGCGGGRGCRLRIFVLILCIDKLSFQLYSIYYYVFVLYNM